MTVFDETLPALAAIFQAEADLGLIDRTLINRDLNGRVRLIIDSKWETDEKGKSVLERVAQKLHERLGPHSFPPEQAILFEPDFHDFDLTFPLEGYPRAEVVDRLATEGDWSSISPETEGVPRIVFYSIKGGVGRSTALAVVAWALAEQGRRVLVLDLDLESPGLSASLLPEDRRPAYGVTDWLVEDLVDNQDAVFPDMVATSELSRNGEILVVAAHGREPGEYLAKLGRVWMPKLLREGRRESWSKRLSRLLEALERRWSPQVVLIDSRAGIDETASAALTDIGASTILLFAVEGSQTWSGYRILFQHWRRTGKARDIRERLQMVGAMVPETDAVEYLRGFRERSWDVFSEQLYDEVPAGMLPEGDVWSFDEADETAHHYPLEVRWNRGFAALQTLHGRLRGVRKEEVAAVFGPLIGYVMDSADTGFGPA